MNEFNYLVDKVLDAKIYTEPFEHIVIDNFLSDDHLKTILSDKQIHFDSCEDTESLIHTLNRKKYSVQSFPGCSTDIKDYIARHESKNWPSERNGTPVETFGLTFRLKTYDNPKVEKIVKYMSSDAFKKAISKKFNLDKPTHAITAIQKNLSYYEISPHPDTRRKAATYLLNINKSDTAESMDIHTHLLKFKENFIDVYRVWKEEDQFDRCWVPWSWCTTEKTIRKNNTIVIFPTTNRSLHAVRLDYDHCALQRTQVYGNLMYENIKKVPQRNYRDLKETIKNEL